MIDYEDLAKKMGGHVTIHFAAMSDLETVRITATKGGKEVKFKSMDDFGDFLSGVTGSVTIKLYSFGDADQSVLDTVRYTAKAINADLFLHSVPYPQGVSTGKINPKHIYDARVKARKDRCAQLGEVPIARECYQRCYLSKKESSND